MLTKIVRSSVRMDREKVPVSWCQAAFVFMLTYDIALRPPGALDSSNWACTSSSQFKTTSAIHPTQPTPMSPLLMPSRSRPLQSIPCLRLPLPKHSDSKVWWDHTRLTLQFRDPWFYPHGIVFAHRWRGTQAAAQRKATMARSPVRMKARSMSMMAQVCDTGPTCNIAWYFVLMVVAWLRIRTIGNRGQ